VTEGHSEEERALAAVSAHGSLPAAA